MPVVTLTTDFGLTDYYVGSLKGTIISHNPGLEIIDISHNIKHYDIVQGAFVLRNVFQHFPPGSIHVINVQHQREGFPRLLGCLYAGHYFLGPDNGIFSLMFDDPEIQFFVMPDKADEPGGMKYCIAQAIQNVIHKKAFQKFSMPAGTIVKKILLQPVVIHNQIRATVIHIDHYENIVINIRRENFDAIRKGRPFELFYRKTDPITQISKHYYDVPVGEVLCLFNDSGFLEIAINMGKAASTLGFHVDDTVQIKFNGESSKQDDESL